MKKQNFNAYKKWLGLALVVAVVLIGAKMWMVKSEKQELSAIYPVASPSATTGPTTFKSHEALGNFTIQVPEGFTIEEKAASIEIIKDGQSIYISMHTTSLDNIDDYLNRLDRLNKTIALDSSKKIINTYSAVVRTIKLNSGETQRTYVFYIDGYIYNIFTFASDLYLIQDQIAQSFKLPI